MIQTAEVKKYYWLKLKENFFSEKEIKKLRRMAGGDTYTIIYLKMLLLSLRTDGRIYFDGVEDSFADELALQLDEETDNVRMTILYLQKVGLMQEVSETEAFLTQIPECVGSETANAERQRRHRLRLIAEERDKVTESGDNVTLMSRPVTKCNTEIEKEKEKDKEIEKEPAADAAAPFPSGKEENETARRIIGYLNEKTGKHFKGGDRTIKLIRARMKEGFGEDDFRTVIDNKTAEWSHDARMAEYLRPETLFGTKFESYLNAAPAGQAASYGAGRESDGESSFDVDELYEAALMRSYGDVGSNVKTN